MNNNLRAFREGLNISQKDFAKSLGLAQTTYNGYETGARDPKSDFWIKIARQYDVSIDYLLGCEKKKSPALSSEAMRLARDYDGLDAHGQSAVRVIADKELERTAEPEAVVDLGTIRHYLSRPAAGVGGLVEGDDYEDIPRTPDMPRNADYCLTVSGDSMAPYIADGQMIYVERDAELRPFDVGVFAVNGEVYVKQYCPTMPGVLMLLSANPEREAANLTILEDGSDTVVYYGKVILDKHLPSPVYK